MYDLFAKDAAASPDIQFFEDFVRQDSVVDLGAFDFVAISSGTIAVGTAADGGWCNLSGAATTDASGAQIQAQAAYTVKANKPISFKARTQLQETTSTNMAVESQWWLGLFPVDTSIDASAPVDGAYFKKADGANTIVCEVRVNSATPVFTATLPATVIEDKAVHTYGITIIPNGTDSSVEFIRDGVTVARATGISLPASTVILTPSVAFRSGDNTGTKLMAVDYVGCHQRR